MLRGSGGGCGAGRGISTGRDHRTDGDGFIRAHDSGAEHSGDGYATRRKLRLCGCLGYFRSTLGSGVGSGFAPAALGARWSHGGLCGDAHEPQKPWSRLDQALRAVDLLLHTGGFRAIVLDLGDIAAEHARRVPQAMWYRFRLQAEKSQTLLLLLTQVACAQSCAAASLCCEAVNANWDEAAEASPALLAGLSYCVRVRRSAVRERSQSIGLEHADSQDIVQRRDANLGHPHPPAKFGSLLLRYGIGSQRFGAALLRGWDERCLARLYLCLHLGDFAAQAVARTDSRLRRRALAILTGMPPLEQVFGMNRSAREKGLEAGMSRIQAESFRELTIVRRKREQEDQAFAEVMACAQRFSPRVQAIDSPRGIVFQSGAAAGYRQLRAAVRKRQTDCRSFVARNSKAWI